MSSKASQTYRSHQINTASPAMLVAMLYDRAITSLRAAIRAIEEGQIETRWKSNKKAVDIISHLWMTLDIDRGGEIAANLDQIYRYAMTHLVKVDVENDPQPARDVIGLLEPLHESWKELADRGVSRTQTQPSAPQRESDLAKTAEEAGALLAGLELSA